MNLGPVDLWEFHMTSAVYRLFRDNNGGYHAFPSWKVDHTPQEYTPIKNENDSLYTFTIEEISEFQISNRCANIHIYYDDGLARDSHLLR